MGETRAPRKRVTSRSGCCVYQLLDRAKNRATLVYMEKATDLAENGLRCKEPLQREGTQAHSTATWLSPVNLKTTETSKD
ncbi:rCG48731 [Rattus norvegicus]|uniref:RCG48731 n=1 Tax=Rattus norvegicus TaxID=10116 RepID=A6IGW9_RAT|nr:rCG48731 [Rattus norvegicus]